MDGWISSLRQALRKLRSTPLLSGAAVLSLGLGIGANATVFRFIEPLFLRSPAVDEPERLFRIFTTDSHLGEVPTFGSMLPVSRLNYEDLRDQATFCDGIAAFQSIFSSWSHDGSARRVEAEIVSGEYFPVLGVEPVLGRAFTRSEGRPEAGVNLVVLQHDFWVREMGGDGKAVGRTMSLNNQEFEIIGIAPPGFEGTSPLTAPDLWVPIGAHRVVLTGQMAEFFDKRRTLSFNVIARLAHGVSESEARSRLARLAAELEERYPDANRHRGFAMAPLAQGNIPAQWREVFSRAGLLLTVVTLLVLLVACCNVANLLLAKSDVRGREIALRMALGASRREVLRAQLSEALVMSLAGAAAALALSQWAAAALWASRPAELDRTSLDLGLGWRVVAATVVIAFAAAFACGALPALRAARRDVTDVLKARGLGRSSHGRRPASSDVLVAGQVTLSVVALTGAMLFVGSLGAVREIDPKIDAEELGVLTFDPALQGYDATRVRGLLRRLAPRVESLPEVSRVAIGTHVPLSLIGASLRSLSIEGEPPRGAGAGMIAGATAVTPGFFSVVGLRLLEGRDFDEGDREQSRRVAIVNRTFADRLNESGLAVGRRFAMTGVEESFEVVGVVEDSRYVWMTESPRPYLYLPLEQGKPDGVLALFVRTPGDPASAVEAARRQLLALDPALPVLHAWKFERVVERSMATSRLAAGLLGAFALLALALTAIGLYGVVAHSVASRRRELAVRMAIGAGRGTTLWTVLRRSFGPVAAGLAVGTAVALGAAGGVGSMLYGISPYQPTTYLITLPIIAGLALVAVAWPAYRASRLSPMNILRS